MNADELRLKSSTERSDLLLELHREQFNLRMQKATGQLSKPAQININRKTIARILTIQTEQGG
jgi:large subunit ribosomal protein L29